MIVQDTEIVVRVDVVGIEFDGSQPGEQRRIVTAELPVHLSFRLRGETMLLGISPTAQFHVSDRFDHAAFAKRHDAEQMQGAGRVRLAASMRCNSASGSVEPAGGPCSAASVSSCANSCSGSAAAGRRS